MAIIVAIGYCGVFYRRRRANGAEDTFSIQVGRRGVAGGDGGDDEANEA